MRAKSDLGKPPETPIIKNRMGAVAQLGERELCKLEVVGSIPIGSTRLRSREREKPARRSPKGEAWASAASYAWQAKSDNRKTARRMNWANECARILAALLRPEFFDK
jgi:hypothetical protein